MIGSSVFLAFNKSQLHWLNRERVKKNETTGSESQSRGKSLSTKKLSVKHAERKWPQLTARSNVIICKYWPLRLCSLKFVSFKLRMGDCWLIKLCQNGEAQQLNWRKTIFPHFFPAVKLHLFRSRELKYWNCEARAKGKWPQNWFIIWNSSVNTCLLQCWIPSCLFLWSHLIPYQRRLDSVKCGVHSLGKSLYRPINSLTKFRT